MGNTERQRQQSDDLLLQIHEQYAINNNANLHGVITLIAAVIVVMGVYGYVFVHSTLNFEDWGNLYVSKSDLYSLDVLLLSCMTSVLIVLILICICVYQGVAQRKEQFIIHAIRFHVSRDSTELLPKRYNPFLKFGLEIVQGLYGELIKFFLWTIALIMISIICKLFIHVFQNYSNGINWCYLLEFLAVCIILAIAFCYSCRYYNLQIFSYILRQVEYHKYMESDELKSLIEQLTSCGKDKRIILNKTAIVKKYNNISKNANPPK